MGNGFENVKQLREKQLRDDDILATPNSPRERDRDAVESLRRTMEAPPDWNWSPLPQYDRRRERQSA